MVLMAHIPTELLPAIITAAALALQGLRAAAQSRKPVRIRVPARARRR